LDVSPHRPRPGVQLGCRARSVDPVSQLLLWDIDHTLIENSGVSKSIYTTAFSLLAPFGPNVPPVTEGKTDRRIMREMFASNGVPLPPWPEVCSALRSAGEMYRTELSKVGYALPGARKLLEAIAARTDVVQTVVTGNIAENAMVKLSAFDLQDFLVLDAGGYGSDSEDRADLVRLAKARCSTMSGTAFGSENTTVVGDTPRDVEAAHRAGARIVAVATGPDSEGQLISAGADVVLADLGDTRRVLPLLIGQDQR
jgi:phosphoglycolate phosphatase-like HAD superfamily hydrolase